MIKGGEGIGTGGRGGSCIVGSEHLLALCSLFCNSFVTIRMRYFKKCSFDVG